MTEVKLTGYFDRNFGDDYMMKIIAHSLPEVMFFIDEKEDIPPVLLQEKNVRPKSAENLRNLPVVLVTGSGFMINSGDALKCEFVWFLKRKHIADICLGCNIEPLDSKLKERLISAKLNKFRTVVCRDKKSYGWICSHCSKPLVYQLPDILFSMPEKWLPPNTGKNKLLIALIHRAGDAENCLYYRQMAEIADYWSKTRKSGVILAAFDAGCENDVFACECVKKHMKTAAENVETVIHGANGEILKAYAGCSKIVGARFHSMVLALKMNIDFFPIACRDKMRSLVSDLSYPIQAENIDNIDIKKIKNFLDSKNVSFKLSPDICNLSEGYTRHLINFLKESRDI